MNKNDNIRTLSASLNGCLPYEYDQKLAAGTQDTLVITKEGSDLTMYISPDENNDDEFIMTYGYDDPNRGRFVEYEPIYRSSEDEQIPLDAIIDNIKHHF